MEQRIENRNQEHKYGGRRIENKEQNNREYIMENAEYIIENIDNREYIIADTENKTKQRAWGTKNIGQGMNHIAYKEQAYRMATREYIIEIIERRTENREYREQRIKHI